MLLAQVAIVGALTIGGLGTPQEKPNFAGTWTPVEGVNPPEPLVVTQTPTLVTATAGDGADHAVEIRLDRQESRQAGGRVRTRAEWDGDRLVVTHNFMSGETVSGTQKQVWSLDGQGRLVIDTSRQRDGETRTTKSIYKRSSRALPGVAG